MPLNPEKNPSFQRHVKEKKLINRTAARIGESFAGKQKRRKKIPETANESFIIMKIAHTHSSLVRAFEVISRCVRLVNINNRVS